MRAQQRDAIQIVAGQREQRRRSTRTAATAASSRYRLGHLLADLDVGDAARQHERDDRLAHGVEVGEREQRWRRANEPTRSAIAFAKRARQTSRAPSESYQRVVGVHARLRPAAEQQHERRDGERAEDGASSGHVRRSRPARAASLPSRRGSRPAVPAERASKRVTRMGCVFEARISPQPSPNSTRTPSTSMTSCRLRKCATAFSTSANLTLVAARRRGSPAC